MLYNILAGIVAYILITIVRSQSSNQIKNRNEFGLVNPSAMSKIYFFNILFILILGGYTYYVFTHQQGWSMYIMLGINTIILLFSYVADFDEEAEESKEE